MLDSWVQRRTCSTMCQQSPSCHAALMMQRTTCSTMRQASSLGYSFMMQGQPAARRQRAILVHLPLSRPSCKRGRRPIQARTWLPPPGTFRRGACSRSPTGALQIAPTSRGLAVFVFVWEGMNAQTPTTWQQTDEPRACYGLLCEKGENTSDHRYLGELQLKQLPVWHT